MKNDFPEEDFEESPEDQMDNDEISPEEEGFLKGYDEAGDADSDFDLNSDED